MKNIDKARNYFIEEIEQIELTIKKHKKVCVTLNCIEEFPVLASTVVRCISISALASSVGIPIGITSSVVGLKWFVIKAICAITARILKYRLMIKKR